MSQPVEPVVRGEVSVQVTAPFLTSVRVASRRLDAGAVRVELERDPSSRTGKRARVVIDVADLALGGATLKSLSLGPPWRLEQHPAQSLRTHLDGGQLSIEVPEPLEGWSTLPPCFFVEGSDGRFSLVTVKVGQVVFDDTDLVGDLDRARGQQGLLFKTAARLRSSLADPVEASGIATQSLAAARAQLASTEEKLGALHAALAQATPEQRAFAALLLSEQGQSLVSLHDAVLEADGHLAHLRDTLATMKGLAPRSELAAVEAEVANAERAASELRAQRTSAVEAVISAASPAQLALRAAQVLGGDWAAFGKGYAADVSDVAFWEGVVSSSRRDAGAARAAVQAQLSAVEAQLAEGQRTIDALAERLRARDGR